MPNTLEQMIAQSRSRSSWNDRLAHWERPASDSEEARIHRAAELVGSALSKRPWLQNHGIQVQPQGSYFNNTNVRLESDMDIGVRHPAVMVRTDGNVSFQQASDALGHSFVGRTGLEIAQDVRREVLAALIDEFGAVNLDPGSKALKVAALEGSRSDADVVPMLRLDYVFARRNAFGDVQMAKETGVILLLNDGSEIWNFPDQHHANGVAKRSRTAHRFKRIVRMCKRLRDELVSLGHIRSGSVPSFLIECLCYRVADDQYLQEEDRLDRLKRVILEIGRLLNSPEFIRDAREINDIKLLFSNDQPWRLDDVQAFVKEAWVRLNSD